MKTAKVILTTSVLAATFLSFSAYAEAREDAVSAAPFQVSVWDSVQVVDRERSIHGFRLTLPYGKNRDIRGFDLGIANLASGDLIGVQFSAGGYVEGRLRGLQYDWLLAIVEKDAAGAQFGVYTSAGALQGVQLGLVNHVAGESEGARLSLVNVAEKSSIGAELGIINYAPRMEGLQLGIVNVTDHLNGVQVGLVNVAKNGFLPVFVVVNAAL